MSDLTTKEQKAVRTALRFLRLRVGTWARWPRPCATSGTRSRRSPPATPALALRVARFAGVPMDDLLAGRWLSARVCPHYSHPPDDFVDEETAVE